MTKHHFGSSAHTLVATLLERALRTPDRLAYVFLDDQGKESSRLSYAQLYGAVAPVAWQLANLAQRGERCLLLLPPGRQYIISFYACLLAGVVAVPVFATTSRRRLQRLHAVIDDSQAEVIVTAPDLKPRLMQAFVASQGSRALRWLTVDGSQASPAADDHASWPLPHPDELAFLQYTSGSTGAPKGVMVSHGNLWHNSVAIQAAYELGPHSTMMSWLPPYHDMGLIGGILQPLFSGCPAVLMAPETFMQKPLRWLQAVSDYRATISGGPNFAYELLARAVSSDELAGLDLSSWTEAYCGAEPIRPSTVDAFCKRFESVGLRPNHFFPCYGLAESTLIVSGGPSKSGSHAIAVDREKFLQEGRARCVPESTVAAGTGIALVSSGMPVHGALVVIADEAGHALPAGHVGEICVHSESVAQGYWRNEPATSRAFRAEIDAWPGKDFLRTGDLGFMQDERLFVTGRCKDLIIVRGRNLYPHDLEDTASNAHPALRPLSCAAFALDTPDGESLGLVLEMNRHAKVAYAEVFSAVRAAMAAVHEIQPAAIALVKAGHLPLTSSGKIQRSECRRRYEQGELNALAVDTRGHGASSSLLVGESLQGQALDLASLAPDEQRQAVEVLVIEAVSRALRLGREQLPIDQPLVEVGMDSLAAVSAVARLADLLGVELPFSKVLGPLTTVTSLADMALSAWRTGGAVASTAPAVTDLVEAAASQGQQGLWFLHRLVPQGSSYNVSFAARMDAATDLNALSRALDRVVMRHDALRTSFFVRDGQVMQRINPRARLHIERIDARDWSTSRLDEHLASQVQHPFHLGGDMLMRVAVLARHDGPIVQFVVHHIVVDFWSLVVLMHEITEHYREEMSGEPARVPARLASYLGFAAWQAGELASARYKASGTWWRENLAEPLPVLALPTDLPRQAVLSEKGASIAFEFDHALTAGIKTLGRRHGATLYNVLLATYFVLLHRLSGQDDLVVGTPTAGRHRAEHEDLVGYFVNSVPLRLALDSQWHFGELLRQVMATTSESFEHAHYPFARIVADQMGERDTSRHPVFQTMFAVQKAHRLEEAGVAPFVLGEKGALLEAGGLRFESYPIEVRSCPFDLWLMMAESDGRLLGSLQYNTDLFQAPTIEAMVDVLRGIVQAVVDRPERAIGRLPLTTASQALPTVAGTLREPDLDTHVLHELFDLQAARTPDAVAMEHGDDHLSYAQLQSKANALAHCLHDQGLEVGARVAILTERGLDATVATLAVLKAGGVYVPLDPSQPRERLVRMAADCACTAVLTTSAHVALANRLHWDVPCMRLLVCLDVPDPSKCIERGDVDTDRKLWDYVAERAKDDIDASGWMNSYTGEHFTREEMAEYVANTVCKLAPHLTPDVRVLEVGCGSGLTMFALADKVSRYHGTDLSLGIIAKNRARAEELGLSHVTLQAMPAQDIDLLRDERFDVVIVNSVIQLFPGHSFLRQFCERAMALMPDRGLLFFGDVMDSDLRQELLRSLHDHARRHAGEGHRTKTDWEHELFLAREYFTDLAAEFPCIVSVEITDKVGEIDNELKRFRYDVVIKVDKVQPRRNADHIRSRRQIGAEVLARYGTQHGPLVSVPKEALAYVMYTSGSTGQPKGIAVPHRAVTRLVMQTDYVTLSGETRMAHLSNPAFDAATFEVWGALLNGGRLCVIDKHDVLSPQVLANRLEASQIDTLFLTSTVFSLTAAQCPGAFRGVGQLLVGGETMDPRAVQRVVQAGGPRRLLNMYGPTECTTFSTWYELADHHTYQSVPLGTSIAYSEACIVDEAWQPVPVGVPGELCIGGPGLAHGYVGRQALTADRFVPHPFATEPGQRMYRTGDRARWSTDGCIHLLGRMDRQVKLRGFRIELDEIEAVLSRCPVVKEGVVVHHVGLQGGMITAYVAAHACDDTVAAVRAFFSRSLPDYMIPANVVILAQLPMTRSGKVDRAALQRQSQEGFVQAVRVTAPPSTDSERMIAGIWQEILSLAAVGVATHFFECGGHSLLATQVASRLSASTGVDIPLRLLFEHPVLADLANQIDLLSPRTGAGGVGTDAQALPPIEPVPRDERPALSYAQQRMWFLSRMDPHGCTYNVGGGIWFDGPLDVNALRAAVQGLVDGHEVLRTNFPGEHEPYQQIADVLPVPWGLVDLELQDAACHDRLVEEEIAAHTRQAFDLAHDPLLRCKLLRLSASRHLLLVSMHHAVCDGWSLGVMFSELSRQYRTLRKGRSIELPPAPLQYADYALWQRRVMPTMVDRHLPYWREKLEGAPRRLTLPMDAGAERDRQGEGRHVPIVLERDLVDGLQALSNQRQVSLFMCLFTAFHILLQRYSGQQDICVGTPVANRNRKELEPLIGFFVNTLVLRVDASGATSFDDLLERVSRTALDAYAHQDLPFDVLVEKLSPTRELRASPLFQVMFSLQNAPTGDLAFEGLQTEVTAYDTGTAKFDLSVFLQPRDGGIEGYFQYDRGRFSQTTMARMVEGFKALLRQLVANPQVRLREMDVLPPHESARIKASFNDTAHEASVACLHRMFEEQVRLHSDRAALWGGDREGWISYGMLNARSNQLAHRLLALGAARGRTVAICMERSAAFVVTAMAIIKTGAAYVPLDPSWPADRLAWMMADAEPCAIVVDSRASLLQVDTSAPCVALSEDAPSISAMPDHDLQVAVHVDDLVYVMYTSGSTGRPKGVMVPHRGVANRFQWQWRIHGYTSRDRFFHKSPSGFDTSAWEMFLPLAYGASLVVADAQGHRDPVYIKQAVMAHGITVIDFVPTMLRAFVDSMGEGERDQVQLQHIILGGEALPDQLVVDCRRWFDAKLYNHYGPTETSIGVTAWICPEEFDGVFIGKPIDNVQTYILDAAMRPVPIGVAGEIHIGGVAVGRGYLNRPGLTSASFVPDPFSSEAGRRLYKTGDLARYREDGQIEYLGRLDHQVKIRGVRIELGEIEAVLLAHPSVKDAVVIADGGESHADRLLAYAVIDREHGVDSSALRRWMADRLPEVMRPSHVMLLASMPLNSNDKVDRRALPRPEPGARDLAEHVSPRNETEASLAKVWSDVLGVDRVGVRDNFFELGGHSLLAIRTVAKIRETLGVNVPLRQLFEFPTIEELACIVAGSSSNDASEQAPIRARARQGRSAVDVGV